MTVTIDKFVAVFPEFATTATGDQFDFWIEQAGYQLNPALFGKSFDLASMLFVAHNIAMGAKELSASDKGAAVGAATGLVSSKSVGGVSVSYDVGQTTSANAGAWNATTYGQRLYKMMQAAACGGIYRAPALSFAYHR